MVATVHPPPSSVRRGTPSRWRSTSPAACPAYSVVGLPDEACRESRDRVRAAVLSSGLTWPAKRITVNLAPATQRKGGSGLDLAIAVGVLVADEQLPSGAFAGHRVRRRARPRRDGSSRRRRRADGRGHLRRAGGGAHGLVPRGPGRHGANGAQHRQPRRAGRALPEARRRGPIRPLRQRSTIRRRRSTWPTSAASRRPGGRWRSPPQAGTTCCSSARRARARRCSPSACLGCCRRSRRRSRWRPRWSTPQRACSCRRAAWCAALRSVLRTTPARWSAWSAAARPPCGRAKPAAATEASCSWTSSASSPGMCSTGCASRWRTVSCASPGHVSAPRCRPASCWSRPRTRARAVVGRPGACSCDEATRARYLRRLSGPLLDRFDLRVGVHRPAVDELLSCGREERTATVAARVAAARARAMARGAMANAAIPPAHLDLWAPLTRCGAPAAASRAGARPAERSRLPPDPPRRPHDRRPGGRCRTGRRAPRRAGAGHASPRRPAGRSERAA